MNNFIYNKKSSPQMDSANVEIHFSYLTQDENKYPAQHHEKGSDKNQFIFIKDVSKTM